MGEKTKSDTQTWNWTRNIWSNGATGLNPGASPALVPSSGAILYFTLTKTFPAGRSKCYLFRFVAEFLLQYYLMRLLAVPALYCGLIATPCIHINAQTPTPSTTTRN